MYVAPHGGAWIEITNSTSQSAQITSPLTEGRGLKFFYPRRRFEPLESPLTEGRGLKLIKVIAEQSVEESPLTEGRGLKYPAAA